MGWWSTSPVGLGDVGSARSHGHGRSAVPDEPGPVDGHAVGHRLRTPSPVVGVGDRWRPRRDIHRAWSAGLEMKPIWWAIIILAIGLFLLVAFDPFGRYS